MNQYENQKSGDLFKKFFNIMDFLKPMEKNREQLKLENYIEILTNKTLRQLGKEIQEKVGKEDFKNTLRESIEEIGEYFNEEEFIQNLETKINSLNIPEETKEQILQQIIQIDENGKKFLNSEWRGTLEDIFRKSPEKRGINFRDQIKDPQELRGFLYLATGDEKFKNDFERLLGQKERFYFSLWPPQIGVSFRKLLPRIEPGFKPGSFFEGVKSYIEDLQKGKDRITFWFEEDLLPEELKGKNEDELRQSGIEKKGGIYEFYLTSDKLKDFFDRWAGTYVEIIKGETEINKILKETKGLYGSLIKDAPPELKDILRQYGSLILGLEERYREMIEMGASLEELNKIKENLDSIRKELEGLKPDIDRYKTTKEKTGLAKIKMKAKEFFEKNGSIILSSIGLWGLAIGWFLPLWLISKMWTEIEKQFK